MPNQTPGPVFEVLQHIDQILQQFFGISMVHIMAGFFGGVVRFFTKEKEGRSFWRFFVSATVGGICAAYMTPPLTMPVQVLFQTTPQAAGGLAGFLIGTSGVYLADVAIKMLVTRFSADKAK